MSGHCCHSNNDAQEVKGAYKKALFIALILNAGMFFIEVYFGHSAESLALWADAIDFFSDSFSYATTLFLISAPLLIKARFAQVKAYAMLSTSLLVAGLAIYRSLGDSTPDAFTMGWVGLSALAANFTCLIVLRKFSDGDSDATAVWECTKNDARANVALLIAAVGVYYTQSHFFDLGAAVFIILFACMGVRNILKHAKADIISAKEA